MLLRKIKMALIRCVSRDFYDSEVLKLEKKYNMKKDAIKDMIYGGLLELMRNPDNYYASSVDFKYNHFTKEGHEAVGSFVSAMCGMIHNIEASDLDARAKELMLQDLKKTY